MINVNYKNIAIIVLSVALAIVSYIAFKHSAPLIDDKLAKMQLTSLKRANDSLIIDLNKESSKSSRFQFKIDSFQKLKPQIKYAYDRKIQDVDVTPISGVINDFNSVFANSNVK